jgi:chromate transporter
MQQSDSDILTTLFLVFLPLSLSAIGRGVAVISEIQHQVVDVHRWTTGDEFLALFAISRASPGPGSMMLATLIGLKLAGLAGAIVATLAMFMPSAVLCVVSAALWRRYSSRGAMVVIEKALIPVGAGLLVAGVASLGQLVSTSLALVAITIGSSIACLAYPAMSPLVVIALGAAANVAAVTLL